MLAISAQSNALLQVVHTKEVIFPLLIEHAQHDHALVVAHGLGPNQLFLGFVTVFEFLENRVPKLLPVQRLGLDAFRHEVDSKTGEDRVFQAFDIPIIGVGLNRNVLFQQVAEDG